MNNSTCAFVNKIASHSVRSLTALLITISLMMLLSIFNISKANTLTSSSYGAFTSTLNDASRAAIIEQNKTLLVGEQFTAAAKTREQLQAQLQQTSVSEPDRQTRALTTTFYLPEFTIYDATTQLYNDLDRDGYYQTLSVIFDPDLYSYDGNNFAQVYARLYLREHGGPWYHYYTSDDFIINGNSNQDSFEVITTFRDGYYPGHYDLLIDLYQVGYNGIVATYSAYDNAALYALPLESSNYDQLYVDSVHIHHGGSLSAGALILLLMVVAIRLGKGGDLKRR